MGKLRVYFRVGFGFDGGVESRVFVILSDGADAGGSVLISFKFEARGEERTRTRGWQRFEEQRTAQ